MAGPPTTEFASFHAGKESVPPGAEIRAKLKLTYQRDEKGIITGLDYEVTEVLAVLPPTPEERANLFPDD